MFERWTVDAIAGEVERQLQVAELSPKLLRRFYKQGRRHGKRSTIPEPTQTLIINAVDIATSKIAEEFVREAQQLRSSIAAADARLGTPLKAPVDVPSPTSEPRTINQPKTGGADLTSALTGVRESKEQSLRQARLAQHAAKEEELVTLGQQRSVAERALLDLPARYRQSVESCHETGELLWSRYRSGYADGASRRGPSESGTAPSQDIRFDDPPVFDELVKLSVPPSKEFTDGVA